MDRRRSQRFVLTGVDGALLEDRKLLSTATAHVSTLQATQARAQTVTAAATTSQSNMEKTLATRNQRIDRLPAFMRSTQVGRFIPQEPLTGLQNDLRSIIGTMKPPPQAVSKNFITQIRSTLARPSVSSATIAGLNRSLGDILAAGNVPAGTIQSIQQNLTAIAQNNIGGRTPNFLVANDYTLVLQTALAVGKPIPGYTPGA